MGDVIRINTLTKGEQFIVDWQYQRPMGEFKTTLARAIMLADGDNLGKLKKGFPDEVEAYEKYAHDRGWWESVQKRASIPRVFILDDPRPVADEQESDLGQEE